MSEQPKLWPLSDEEMPTDREWTDLEWLRHQLWLANEAAPEVSEAMVERGARKIQWILLQKRFEIGFDEARRIFRAALRAALTQEGNDASI